MSSSYFWVLIGYRCVSFDVVMGFYLSALDWRDAKTCTSIPQGVIYNVFSKPWFVFFGGGEGGGVTGIEL